ncbi:MAG: S1C family serine protease [Anaerolineales bacterium]
MRASVRFPIIVLSALLIVGLACGFNTSSVAPTVAPVQVVTQVVPVAATFAPQPPLTVSSSEEEALIALYERVNPAVVAILVGTNTGGGQGSGFLYDVEGHIVTNQHVVEGAAEIEVDFASGLKTRGRVVGADPDSDLAVVKVDEIPAGVSPLPLADSDALKIGQRAIAIGNPFGEAGTMTLGIISGLGRSLSSNRSAEGGGRFTAPNIIQTDAPINPGNSGGPLLNLSGEVIGLNRAIAIDPESDNRSNSGVGYSIAANTIKQIVPFLIREGRFIYPYLGISSAPEIGLGQQEEWGLPQTDGTYVTTVIDGGPAARGGVQADSSPNCSVTGGCRGDGDLIVGVDGRAVRSLADLMSYLINNKRPGDEVTLIVFRSGEQREVQVVLGERP